MLHRALISFALVFSGLGAAAQDCRQALALGLDVSGSVDMGEYRTQLDGIAWALDDPEVRSLLLETPQYPVQIYVFEWSDSNFQRRVLDWTPASTHQDLDKITNHLRRWGRVRAAVYTGLGAAMAFGAEALRAGPNCERKTLDISGDGKNNDHPRPRDVKRAGQLGDITVNALVIGERPTPENPNASQKTEALASYFQAHVIHGPGSFIEIAEGYEEYGVAMKRKLIREIGVLVLGETQSAGQKEG